MRRILVPLLLVILFSMNVQAETYKISGRATYADDTPVALQYVAVDCEQGVIDCYQYRGTQTITDAYGYFTILIETTEDDNPVKALESTTSTSFSRSTRRRGSITAEER